MTDFTNISARAMLVTLNISTWSGRKIDKKATRQVNDRNKAADEAGRYNKHILAGAEEHHRLLIRAVGARERHYEETLPWSDEGWRLLPTSNYEQYVEVMRKEKGSFDRALDDFIDAYPQLRRRACEKLGSLYNAKDYPNAEVVRARFNWAIGFGPVPSCNDIRVDLPKDTVDMIGRQVEDRVQEATREAMRDAWRRLHEAVQRVAKATAPDGIVRGTLIEHVREVVAAVGRMNVAQDADLDKMRKRVERELARVEPETLRRSPDVRADIVRKTEAIAASMAGFYKPDA